MLHRGEFRFLGTGASVGVPVVGCLCAVCQKATRGQGRLRSSGLLQLENKALLVDVGPDFRQQALKWHITHIDGLLLTHPHFDHIAGIDDLRVFSLRRDGEIPCLASRHTCQDLLRRYDYLFKEEEHHQTVRIKLHELAGERGSVDFLGIHIAYCSYLHGKAPVTGFRIGNFAYITDIKQYPESLIEDLRGVESIVVSALRPQATDIHFGVDDAVAFIEKCGAKKGYLTHLSHHIDPEKVAEELPPNVQLGYDGLLIPFAY